MTPTVNTYSLTFTAAEWAADWIGCVVKARGEARRQGALEYEVVVKMPDGERVVKRGKV